MYLYAAIAVLGLIALCLFGKKSGGKKVPLFGPDPTADPKDTAIPGHDVIRQGWKKNVIENPDAIVIGSGIGGLATAAFLARAGKKVLVLEAHDRAGGCSHTFDEHGWEWDVGIHYIGRMHDDTAPNKVIMDAITDNKVKWHKMHEAFDTAVVAGKEYPMYAGREKQIQGLIKEFPKEEQAIRQYFKDISKAKQSSAEYFLEKVAYSTGGLKGLALRTALKIKQTFSKPSYHKWVHTTVEGHLRTLTNDDKLVGVLAYCYGDYGTKPSEAPFFMHAILVDHYIHGGYYPVGGASVIARTIVPVIKRHGGAVLCRARVQQIICQGNRAIGVQIQDGPAVYAPIIVSNAGFHNTYNRLLPRQVAQASGLVPEVNQLGHSATHLSLFVGLKGSNSENKLESRNYWCFPTYNHDENVAASEENPLENLSLFYISFPSAKDPEWDKDHPGKSTATVISTAPYELFEDFKNAKVKKRGPAYERMKQELTDQMVAALVKVRPDLKNKIAYTELGTPLSTQYYIEAPKGESYGLDHMPERFKTNTLIPTTPVAGLYMTGQDVVTAGFISALFGGLLTASTILDRNLYMEMLSHQKKLRQAAKADKKQA